MYQHISVQYSLQTRRSAQEWGGWVFSGWQGIAVQPSWVTYHVLVLMKLNGQTAPKPDSFLLQRTLHQRPGDIKPETSIDFLPFHQTSISSLDILFFLALLLLISCIPTALLNFVTMCTSTVSIAVSNTRKLNEPTETRTNCALDQLAKI